MVHGYQPGSFPQQIVRPLRREKPSDTRQSDRSARFEVIHNISHGDVLQYNSNAAREREASRATGTQRQGAEQQIEGGQDSAWIVKEGGQEQV